MLLLLNLAVRHLRQLKYLAAHQLDGVAIKLVVLRHLVDSLDVVLEVSRLRLQLVYKLRCFEALLDVRLADGVATRLEAEHLELAVVHLVTWVHKERLGRIGL